MNIIIYMPGWNANASGFPLTNEDYSMVMMYNHSLVPQECTTYCRAMYQILGLGTQSWDFLVPFSFFTKVLCRTDILEYSVISFVGQMEGRT